jgi:hypothetical protein
MRNRNPSNIASAATSAGCARKRSLSRTVIRAARPMTRLCDRARIFVGAMIVIAAMALPAQSIDAYVWMSSTIVSR